MPIRILALCGSPECQPTGPAWEYYGDYLRRLDPEGSKSIPYEQFIEDDAASKSPWTRTQHPRVADYLGAHATQFDLIAKAVRIPGSSPLTLTAEQDPAADVQQGGTLPGAMEAAK